MTKFFCGSRSALPIVEWAGQKLNLRTTEDTTQKRTSTAVWLSSWREMEKLLSEEKEQERKIVLSKFPDMQRLCNKRKTAKMFSRLKRISPEKYSFWPESYLLPDDIEKLAAAFDTTLDPVHDQHSDIGSKKKSEKAKPSEKPTFIVKPEDGSQGDGIFLVQSIRDLETRLAGQPHDLYLVQRYISNPMLLENKKFDLRIYCLITSLSPVFEVWLCKEGMVRLCTETYKKPTGKNLKNVYAHLTNYSLNKLSDNYDHSSDAFSGNKRTLSSFFLGLASSGIDVSRMQESMESLTYHTAEAMKPYIQHNCVKHFEAGSSGQCFQILGLDVMIEVKRNGNFELRLLEINGNPSMAIDDVVMPEDLTEREQFVVPIKGKWWKNGVGERCDCRDGKQGHVHRISAIDRHIKEAVMCGALAITLSKKSRRWTKKNALVVEQYKSGYTRLQFAGGGMRHRIANMHVASMGYLVLNGLRMKYESLIGISRQNTKPLNAYKMRLYMKEVLRATRHPTRLTILECDMIFTKKKQQCMVVEFDHFVDMMFDIVSKGWPAMFPSGSHFQSWSAEDLMSLLLLEIV